MTRRLVVPRDVAWTDEDEGGVPFVYVATLPRGPIVVLAGTAALTWHAALSGDATTVADRVATAVDQPAGVLREDVSGFVDDLVGRGLLEWV